MSNPKRKRRNGRRRKSNPFAAHRKTSRRGSRRGKRSNPFGFKRRSTRRRNPAILGLSPTAMLQLGAGAAAGSFGTRAIPQAILGDAHNSGITGYVANLATALGLGWAAQKFVGRDAALGVVAGGLAALGLRIWTERVSLTSPSLVSGMGDYDFSSTGMGWYQTPNNVQGNGGPYLQSAPASAGKGAAPSSAAVVSFPRRGRARA